MITAILIDDERNALDVLVWQLKNYCPDVTVLACCNNVQEAIQEISTHKPDLVFLDIEMPVQSGFSLLETFEDPDFDVIFTTAYNQYAIKAFKFSAFDYLLKPIDADDLKETVARYIGRKRVSIREQIKELALQLQPKPPGKIAIPTNDGLVMFRPEQIIRCESESNYSKVFLDNGKKLIVAKTLKELEEVLEPYQFYRIHHSHLINLGHVQSYTRYDGGFVLMSDGTEVSLAKNRKQGFIEQFSKL